MSATRDEIIEVHKESFENTSAWLAIIFIFAILFWVSFIFLIWYANGLRVDNIAKNKQVCELQGYKQAWIDFNRTHIPETALPRIPEIEAIYMEEVK